MSSAPEPPNVAVVDDDESIGRAFARMLRAAGIRAVVYRSAESFLADAERPRFDCLLLDVRLGGMSGLELQQTLVRVGDATPVIFITAHDDDAHQEAKRAGCFAYFRKTAPGAEILAAIGAAREGVGS